MPAELVVVGHLGRDFLHRDGRPVDSFYGGSLVHWVNGASHLGAGASIVSACDRRAIRPLLELWRRIGHDTAGVAGAPRAPEFHCHYAGGVFDDGAFEARGVPDLGGSVGARGVPGGAWLHLCPLPLSQVERSVAAICAEHVRLSLQTHGSLLAGPSERSVFKGLLARAEFAFLSAGEARLLAGVDDLEDASLFLSRAARTVFVTDETRARVVRRGEVGPWVPSLPATVVDPTGAGDTFAGAAVGALASGASPETALLVASSLATHAVGGVLGRALHERLERAFPARPSR